MVRSFSYAAHAATFSAAGPGKEHGQSLPDRAHVWEAAVTREFLAAYRDATVGAAFIPPVPGAFEVLLEAFILDKALYEVEYELATRPDWAIIPLLGILRIVDAPASASGYR